METTPTRKQLLDGAAAFAIKYAGEGDALTRKSLAQTSYYQMDRDHFDLIDRNHDGKIDASEITARLGQVSDGELQQMQGKDADWRVAGSIGNVMKRILGAISSTSVAEERQLVLAPSERVTPVDVGATAPGKESNGGHVVFAPSSGSRGDAGVVYTESYRDQRRRVLDSYNAGRAVGSAARSLINGILR